MADKRVVNLGPIPMMFLCSCFMIMAANAADQQPLKVCNFDQMYQLGDSLSDTGNHLLETKDPKTFPCANPPYGETFFKKATGRCSNGLLLIDYFAMAAGLQLLNPYDPIRFDTRHGVNFAFAGATAMSDPALRAKNITNPVTLSNLDVQLDLAATHFGSICFGRDYCVAKLKNALFFVGEIGLYDYTYPLLLQGWPVANVKALAPDVISAISDGVTRVIQSGGSKIVVPGSLPIGCLPPFLTAFKTNNSAAYDDHHCIKELNDLALHHNDLVKQAVVQLQKDNPNTLIVYGDYYNAFINLLTNAPSLGFDVKGLQKDCCGIGGDYNFDLKRNCGAAGVPVCPQPEKSIFWDGINLTQQSYKIMTDWLIKDLLPKLKCT